MPSVNELRAFDGRIFSPLGMLLNIPIDLGSKMILINFAVMIGPMDYNILLGRDSIYAMSVVVSSLFRVMIFPHEGCIITIDQLSYTDPPPQDSHNIISHHVAHIESMHYVSITTRHVTLTPLGFGG